MNRSVRAAAPSVRFACQWDGLNPSVSFADSSPSRGALGKKDEPYAMPKAPLLAGAVAAGDWGVQPQINDQKPPVPDHGTGGLFCGSVSAGVQFYSTLII